MTLFLKSLLRSAFSEIISENNLNKQAHSQNLCVNSQRTQAYLLNVNVFLYLFLDPVLQCAFTESTVENNLNKSSKSVSVT